MYKARTRSFEGGKGDREQGAAATRGVPKRPATFCSHSAGVRQSWWKLSQLMAKMAWGLPGRLYLFLERGEFQCLSR